MSRDRAVKSASTLRAPKAGEPCQRKARDEKAIGARSQYPPPAKVSRRDRPKTMIVAASAPNQSVIFTPQGKLRRRASPRIPRTRAAAMSDISDRAGLFIGTFFAMELAGAASG
jgi:hypothetical protein